MKFLLSSALLLFTILATQASDKPEIFRNQAVEITRNLANQIGLNESEFIQVKNYTLEKLVASDEIKDMYQHKPEMMQRKLQELEAAYAHNVQSIFSNKQIDNYLTLNTNAKSRPILLATGNE
jgi:hypothetical protein